MRLPRLAFPTWSRERRQSGGGPPETQSVILRIPPHRRAIPVIEVHIRIPLARTCRCSWLLPLLLRRLRLLRSAEAREGRGQTLPRLAFALPNTRAGRVVEALEANLVGNGTLPRTSDATNEMRGFDLLDWGSRNPFGLGLSLSGHGTTCNESSEDECVSTATQARGGAVGSAKKMIVIKADDGRPAGSCRRNQPRSD